MPVHRDLPDVSGGFWPMRADDIPTFVLLIIFTANMLAIHLLFGYSVWPCYFLAFLPMGLEITLAVGFINLMRARRVRRNTVKSSFTPTG